MVGPAGTAVLQVIGGFTYRKLNVIIESGTVIETVLSGDAYCRSLAEVGNECGLVLIVPESIVTHLTSDPAEAAELIKDKGAMRAAILEKARDTLGIRHDRVDTVIVPSIGHYRERDGAYSVSFKGTRVGDIRLKIVLDLLHRSLTGERLIADTSTGHNIYVGSLLRALRDLQVIAGLAALSLSDREPLRPPQYGVAALEPVPDVGTDAHYIIDYVTAEAFFHYPLGHEDSKRVKEEIFDTMIKQSGLCDIARLRKQVLRWLTKGLVLYNAVAYNAPLAFLNLGRELSSAKGPAPRETLLSLAALLSRYLDKANVAVFGQLVNVEKAGLNRPIITRLIISLIMADALVALASRLDKEVSVEDGYSLRKIGEMFPRLYSNLGIKGPSTHTLEVEIIKIKNGLSDSREAKRGEWVLLNRVLDKKEGEIDKSDKEKEKKKGDKKGIFEGSSPKRNFFAHSGFLKNITEGRFEGDEILVRYVRTKKTAMDWEDYLRNP